MIRTTLLALTVLGAATVAAQNFQVPSNHDAEPPYHKPLVFKAGAIETLLSYNPSIFIHPDRVDIVLGSPPPGWGNVIVYPKAIVDSWPGGYDYWAYILKSNVTALKLAPVTDLR